MGRHKPRTCLPHRLKTLRQLRDLTLVGSISNKSKSIFHSGPYEVSLTPQTCRIYLERHCPCLKSTYLQKIVPINTSRIMGAKIDNSTRYPLTSCCIGVSLSFHFSENFQYVFLYLKKFNERNRITTTIPKYDDLIGNAYLAISSFENIDRRIKVAISARKSVCMSATIAIARKASIPSLL